MCFGIRKLPPLHLDTSILPIQNNKNPKNAINAWADTQIYPLLHHQIQYKAPLCSCGPISWGAHMKFSTMFFMNSCVSSVWKMFNKRWKVSVLQVSPISMDNTVRPPKRDDEWNITGNHTQALFLVWRTNYWILCSLSVLERDYCAGKHRLALGCWCKVFAAKTTISLQHFRWLWRNLCVRACVYSDFRVLMILNG